MAICIFNTAVSVCRHENKTHAKTTMMTEWMKPKKTSWVCALSIAHRAAAYTKSNGSHNTSATTTSMKKNLHCCTKWPNNNKIKQKVDAHNSQSVRFFLLWLLHKTHLVRALLLMLPILLLFGYECRTEEKKLTHTALKEKQHSRMTNESRRKKNYDNYIVWLPFVRHDRKNEKFETGFLYVGL